MVDFLPEDEDLKPNLILIIKYLVTLHVSSSLLSLLHSRMRASNSQQKGYIFQSQYSNDDAGKKYLAVG